MNKEQIIKELKLDVETAKQTVKEFENFTTQQDALTFHYWKGQLVATERILKLIEKEKEEVEKIKELIKKKEVEKEETINVRWDTGK